MKKLLNKLVPSRALKSSSGRSVRLLLAAPTMMVWSILSTSCVTPEEMQLDEDQSDFEWNDIMESASERPSQRNRYSYRLSPGATMAGLPRPPDNLHKLIQYLPQDGGRAVSQPSTRLPVSVPYEGGYYGTRGLTKIFIAPTTKIGDYSRLYWVMVKVLSEKYGCFMVAKQYARDTTRVFCRDKRQIVFWQSRTKDWIQFATRQYDRDGFEIAVKRRRIVRVSNNPVI